MELHSLAELECVGQAVFRNRPLIFRDIADDLGIVLRIEAKQRAVVRRNRMKHRKSRLSMPIKRRRGAAHGEHQLAAASGTFFLGAKKRWREKNERDKERDRNLYTFRNRSCHEISS